MCNGSNSENWRDRPGSTSHPASSSSPSSSSPSSPSSPTFSPSTASFPAFTTSLSRSRNDKSCKLYLLLKHNKTRWTVSPHQLLSFNPWPLTLSWKLCQQQLRRLVLDEEGVDLQSAEPLPPYDWRPAWASQPTQTDQIHRCVRATRGETCRDKLFWVNSSLYQENKTPSVDGISGEKMFKVKFL